MVTNEVVVSCKNRHYGTFINRTPISNMTMCDDPPLDAPEFPIWNRRALSDLRDEFHATPAELDCLLEAERDQPAFDPIKVRDLLRAEHAAGLEPDFLILGQMEMASFRHFVARGFGEESGSPLGGLYFLGIPVVADASPSRLEFVVEDCTSTDPGNRTTDPSNRSAA